MISDFLKSKHIHLEEKIHNQTVKNGDLDFSPEKTWFEESPQITVKKKLKDILIQKSKVKERVYKAAEDQAIWYYTSLQRKQKHIKEASHNKQIMNLSWQEKFQTLNMKR